MRRDGFCPMCGTPCIIVGEVGSIDLNKLQFERKEPEPVQVPCTHVVDPLLTAWQRLANLRCALAKKQNNTLPRVEMVSNTGSSAYEVSLYLPDGHLWQTASGSTFGGAVDALATIFAEKEQIHV